MALVHNGLRVYINIHINFHFQDAFAGSSFDSCFVLLYLQISKYVQHNDAILLVVVPATMAPEISSYRALRIAKEYDTEGGFILNLKFLILLGIKGIIMSHPTLLASKVQDLYISLGLF